MFLKGTRSGWVFAVRDSAIKIKWCFFFTFLAAEAVCWNKYLDVCRSCASATVTEQTTLTCTARKTQTSSEDKGHFSRENNNYKPCGQRGLIVTFFTPLVSPSPPPFFHLPLRASVDDNDDHKEYFLTSYHCSRQTGVRCCTKYLTILQKLLYQHTQRVPCTYWAQNGTTSWTPPLLLYKIPSFPETTSSC